MKILKADNVVDFIGRKSLTKSMIIDFDMKSTNEFQYFDNWLSDIISKQLDDVPKEPSAITHNFKRNLVIEDLMYFDCYPITVTKQYAQIIYDKTPTNPMDVVHSLMLGYVVNDSNLLQSLKTYNESVLREFLDKGHVDFNYRRIKNLIIENGLINEE